VPPTQRPDPATRDARVREYARQLDGLTDEHLRDERKRVEEAFYWSRHDGSSPAERQEWELRWNAVMTQTHAREKPPRDWTYRHDERDAFTFKEQPQPDGSRVVTAEGWIPDPDATINWRSHTLYGEGRAAGVQAKVSAGSGDDGGHLAASEFGADPEGVNAGQARRGKHTAPADLLNYGLQNRQMNRKEAWYPVERAVAREAKHRPLYLKVEARTSPELFDGERESHRTMTVSEDEEGKKPITVSIPQRHHSPGTGATHLGVVRNVELNRFDFGNFDSHDRRKALGLEPDRKEMFVASRLSALAYEPFDAQDPARAERARAEVRAGARLYGFDRVEFVWDDRTHTQAVVACNRQTGQALVAFRGSDPHSGQDLATNLSCGHAYRAEYYGKAGVHGGFDAAVEGVFTMGTCQPRTVPEALAAMDPPVKSVSVAGHSQGGAEAQLAAARLAVARYKVEGVYSFGAPHVSDDPALGAHYEKLGVRNVVRVEKSGDCVAQCNTLNPGNSYSAALGGRPPGESAADRARVGTFQYVTCDGTLLQNPPPEVVDRDSREQFWRRLPEYPDLRFKDHFHYDAALYRNLDLADQVALKKQFAGQRREAGERLHEARPGTPGWAGHGEREAEWNAARREQAALEGQDWTSKVDRRFQFAIDVEAPGRPNRQGVTHDRLTVRGELHGPQTTINWLYEERYFARDAPGNKRFEAEAARGRGCLVSPAFGIDPADPRYYDARAATPAYGAVQRSLLHGAGTDEAPAKAPGLTVTLRNVTDRDGVQSETPPQVTVSQDGEPAQHYIPQAHRGVDGPAPVSPAPSVAAPRHEPTPERESGAPARERPPLRVVAPGPSK
jgi:hypothetical protein